MPVRKYRELLMLALALPSHCKVCVKTFDVIGKALSGKLPCTQTCLVCLPLRLGLSCKGKNLLLEANSYL